MSKSKCFDELDGVCGQCRHCLTNEIGKVTMSQIECRIGCTHVESILCSKIAAWKALEEAANSEHGFEPLYPVIKYNEESGEQYPAMLPAQPNTIYVGHHGYVAIDEANAEIAQLRQKVTSYEAAAQEPTAAEIEATDDMIREAILARSAYNNGVLIGKNPDDEYCRIGCMIEAALEAARKVQCSETI